MRYLVLVLMMQILMGHGKSTACTFQWDPVTKYMDNTAVGSDPVTYKVQRKDNSGNVRIACTVTNSVTCSDNVCDAGEYTVVAVNTFGTESAKSNMIMNKQLSAVINFRGFVTP